MWLGMQDVWVWDAERDKVSLDGATREMAGEYICVEVYGVGIEDCVQGMSWGMEVHFL